MIPWQHCCSVSVILKHPKQGAYKNLGLHMLGTWGRITGEKGPSKKEISHHIVIESLKLLRVVSGLTSSFSSVIKRLSLKTRRKDCFSLSSQRTSDSGDRVKLPFPRQRLGTWRTHPGGRTSRANVMARLGHRTLSLAESISEKR